VGSSAELVVAVVDLQWLGSLPTCHIAVVESLLALGFRVVSFSPAPDQVVEESSAGTGAPSRLVVRSLGVARSPVRVNDQPPHGGIRLRDIFRRYAPSWALAERDRFLARTGWASVCRYLETFRWDNGDPIGHVIFPYLDHPIVSLLARGRIGVPDLDRPWSGLWVHPDPRPSARREMRTVLKGLSRLNQFRGFWSLDETLPGWIDDVHTGSWLGRFPDVTREELLETEGILEREIRRFGDDGPVVLLAGELSARKGIHELLAAARQAGESGSCLRFVVAGPLDEASCDREAPLLRSLLGEAPSNVRFFPGWIPDGHEFNAAVRGASVIWAAYRDFPFSSNLLTKAAMVRRPIVVNRNGLMADRVRTHGLGEVIVPSDSGGTVRVLEKLVDAQWPLGNEAYERYFQNHSRLNLQAVLRHQLPAI